MKTAKQQAILHSVLCIATSVFFIGSFYTVFLSVTSSPYYLILSIILGFIFCSLFSQCVLEIIRFDGIRSAEQEAKNARNYREERAKFEPKKDIPAVFLGAAFYEKPDKEGLYLVYCKNVCVYKFLIYKDGFYNFVGDNITENEGVPNIKNKPLPPNSIYCLLPKNPLNPTNHEN